MPTATALKPLMSAAPALSGPLEDLRDALRFVKPAVSKEETRYYLNGVYFDLTRDAVLIRATDGHRLHQVSMPMHETAAWPRRIFLSSAAVSEICKLKASECKDQLFTINFEARTVLARKSYSHNAEGSSEIDLDRVQPRADAPLMFAFRGDAIMPALETALGVNRYACPMRFQLNAESADLELSARISHKGGTVRVSDAIDTLEIARAPGIGFNAAYVRDAVLAFGRYASVAVHYHDASSPTLWTEYKGGSSRHVVLMPLRV